MAITFDPTKDTTNIARHGVSLRRAADLKVLAIVEDDRFDYGEQRFRAFGLIDTQPHSLAFTERDGVVRAISLRRAHAKEYDRYVKSTTQKD